MPLPLLAAAAAPSAISAAQAGVSAGIGAIGGAFQTFANNKLQKRNNEILAALLEREQQGRLGMSPNEQRLLNQQLRIAPQRAVAASQRNAERLMGGRELAAGDLATLRQETARQQADIAENAAAQVRAANEAKRAANLQQIEDRAQAQAAMVADDFNTVLGSAADAARVGGQAAGAPPGTFTLTGPNGSRPPAAALAPSSPEPFADADAARYRSVLEAYLGGSENVDEILKELAARSAATTNPAVPAVKAVR